MPALLEDNRLVLEGDVNSATVATLVGISLAHVRNGAESVDFSAVTDVDSAAVALALQCAREARSLNRTLTFSNLSPKFIDLARLYNVSDLFTDARA